MSYHEDAMAGGIILATSIYLLLTAAVLISTVCPSLKALSSHGKTRSSNDGCNKTHDTVGIFPRLWFLFNGLTVNKHRFIDFYTAGIFMALLLFFTIIASDPNNDEIPNEDILPSFYQWLPFSLSTLHLIRRYSECKWVQKSDASSQMHLAGYVLGILHYLCLPFVMVPFLSPACAIDEQSGRSDMGEVEPNGVCNMSSSIYGIHYTMLRQIVDIAAIFGCIYFQYEQHRHHVILANLRNTTPKSYSLPTEGWFDYVSCPHYLAEIMIYFMFALLLNNSPYHAGEDNVRKRFVELNSTLNMSIPQWLDLSGDNCVTMLTTIYRSKHWILLVWVAANLTISSKRTHEWYLKNFGAAYPLSRTRLVPFVW